MNMTLQQLLQQFESREGEKIQHVLIGSPEGIQEVKQTLHALRYVEIALWSPIVPMPGSGSFMSVLTRYRSIPS